MTTVGRSSRGNVALVAFAAALVLLAMPRYARGDLTCADVKSALWSCRWYCAVGWPGPSRGCCNGVRSMADPGRTTQERRTICGCLESFAKGHSGGVVHRALGLPAKCGVTLSYELSPSMDCNTIN